MIVLRKRGPGSMFKRFFIFLSVTVVFCLTVSSFFLVFLFSNFWKTERLTSLSNDALCLAQSVELLYEDSQDDISLTDEKNGYVQLIAGNLLSISESSSTDLFLVDMQGHIFMCKDKISVLEEDILTDVKCSVHDNVCIDEELLSQATLSSPITFSREGKLYDLSETEFFIALSPVVSGGEIKCFAVAAKTEGEAYLPYTTEFVRMFIISELMSIFVVFIISLIASFTLVKPLKNVTQATKHYSKGDFSVRINSYDSYKELAELIESVNVMADNLAVYEESRSNFVANVSHELKTPMTIISGFIDGILDGTIPEEESEKYLQIVSDEVKRLSRLVIAMLNMSKIEAGQLNLNLSQVELSDLIIRTFIGFEKVINEKKINVLGIDTLERVIISADDALINQIIYNLIDNAVKFTPKDGVISFTLTSDKKDAVMKIRNTGTGISHEECNLVFDRFYKVDKSRGLDSKSFGMGLHISKSIVELHKGTISINSMPDEYTEFIIKLPVEN